MARRQEILLTQDVLKLGNMGDIVRVAPGYARNYLYPHALAMPASAAAKRQIEVLRAESAKSEIAREGRANGLKKTMEGMSIQIASRVAHDNELFGSIGTRDIVAALAKSGVEVDGKQVHLHDKIKRIGKYEVTVKLHKNVSVTIHLEIINSDPNAPTLDETLAAAGNEPEAKEEAPAEAKAEAPAKGKKAEVKIKNLGSGKKHETAEQPADTANAPVGKGGKGKGKKA